GGEGARRRRGGRAQVRVRPSAARGCRSLSTDALRPGRPSQGIRPSSGRRTTPAGIYLLDGRRADIKNEKEGMKYIRFPGRSGASRWRIDETEDPCDHLRRLLRGRRLLFMDVRGGP